MQKAQPLDELSHREKEIFDLLLAGSTPKEIGFKLKIFNHGRHELHEPCYDIECQVRLVSVVRGKFIFWRKR